MAGSLVVPAAPNSGTDLTAGATTVITTSHAYQAGNKIVGVCAYQSNLNQLLSVAGGGLTWTIDAQLLHTSSSIVIFSADVPAGGVPSGVSITLTWNAGGDNRRAWELEEWAGLAAGGPAANYTATGAVGSPSQHPLSGPPTNVANIGDAVVTAHAYNLNVTQWAADNGFTTRDTVVASAGITPCSLLLQDWVASQTGTVVGSATVQSASAAWASATVIYPAAAATVSTAASSALAKTAEAKWRVVVCDRYGAAISNVSSIAFGKQYQAILNRPAMFTFRVPSADVRVAGLHSDGYPYVGWGNRTVRAYRRELQPDGSYAWVIRFAGHVWQVEDDGDAEQAWTTVTCFDPLQLLNKRIVRRMRVTGDRMASGFVGDDTIYDFDVNSTVDGSVTAHPSTEYARGLLATTNRYDGNTGLGDYYGTWPALGLAITATPVTPSVTVHYSLGTKVGDAILSLVQTYNHFDLEVMPVDSAGYSLTNQTAQAGQAADYPGLGLATFRMLGLLRFYAPQRGTARPGVIFAWGQAPHTASGIRRSLDAERAVNNMYMTGVTAGVGHAVNLTSIQTYPVLMDSQQASDGVGDLSAVANEAAQVLGKGAPVVEVTPMAGRCPLPWDNFTLGDTVGVAAGAKLRGGFNESHRVYGFTLDILDDHTTEVLSQVVTSPV